MATNARHVEHSLLCSLTLPTKVQKHTALLVGCFPVSPPHLAASIFTPVLHKLQQGQ